MERCPCLDGDYERCILKNAEKIPWTAEEASYARLKTMPAVANAPKEEKPKKKILSPREMNGPDGYPKPGTNSAFDKAAAELVRKIRPEAERSEQFLQELARGLRESDEE